MIFMSQEAQALETGMSINKGSQESFGWCHESLFDA
jgi:hypothetical protein